MKQAAEAIGLVLVRFNPTAPPIIRDGQRIMRRGVNEPGVADLLGLAPGGRFVAIEVKSEDGKLRPEQALFLDRVTQYGGLALVARGIDEIRHLHLVAQGAGSWWAVKSPFTLPDATRRDYMLAVERKRVEREVARVARRRR